MRRWLVLTLLTFALAGCKHAEKDRPRPTRDDLPPADPASRTRPKKGWLDGPTPNLSAVDAPSADSWTSPHDPKFDVNREVRGILAGFVEDPDGRKLKDVFIEVELADPAAAGEGAPVGVMTDRQGYFLIKGLKPKQTYVLTAQAKMDGKPLGGRAYAQTSADRSQFIRLALIDGLEFPGTGRASPVDKPTIPVPEKGDLAPPPVVPSGGSRLPEPVPFGDSGPAPPPRTERVNDGGLSPLRPRSDMPPPIPAVPGDAAPPRSVVPRPDLMTEGKDGLFRPPPASLPKAAPEKPRVPQPGESQSRSVLPRSEFVLLDPTGARREFPSGRPDELVLLDFMTTTCVPCKKAIPTLKGLQSKYGLRGLEVVGVLCDTVSVDERRALASKYQRAEGLNYLLYVEPGATPGALGERFDVKGYPTVVLLDGTGEVLWTGHPSDVGSLERAVATKLGLIGK